MTLVTGADRSPASYRVNYTTSGTHDFLIRNGPCVDTVRLNLTIGNGALTDTTVVACGSFTWDRTGVNYTTSGTHDFLIPNGPCVDTVRLNLTIGNGALTDTLVTACGSFTWDRTGVNYTTSGTHDFLIPNGPCVDTVRRFELDDIGNGALTDTLVDSLRLIHLG